MGFLDFIKRFLGNNNKTPYFIVKNLSKKAGEKGVLEVGLYDNKTPLVNEKININIHGVDYTRSTDENGIAKLNINLGTGEYKTYLDYSGNDNYNKVSSYCIVKVNPVLITNNLTMGYKDGSKFSAKLVDSNNKVIGGQEVKFTINGVDYTRSTDENGIAKLNINLLPGEYTIISSCIECRNENKVIINKMNTHMEGTNINKTFSDKNNNYQCAVYNNSNERIFDKVTMNVNGLDYTKSPDTNGLYHLNINLPVGTYTITSTFNGNQTYNPSSVKNSIVVKEDPKPTPQKTKSYSEEILDYFVSKFGKVSCIDDCLEAVQDCGYGFYYDDKLTNKQTIDGLAKRGGTKPNCTDIHHVFWHLGKALGYDVRAVHVRCKSGTGHVRLDFNKGDGWFSRDASAVADGNCISCIWCSNGTILAYNPSWFSENLYR